MEYGSQSSVVTTTIDDAMPAAMAVIADEQLGRLAVESAQTADSLIFTLQNLATDLAAATGSESEGGTATHFGDGLRGTRPDIPGLVQPFI